ncbi:regulation of synaptic plasticity by receptor localization to synapse [Homalodisca vitripennis]|nr:regulation of synaptic plasticity by receptor localization to synapse [Homalodisca vitripennis]
MSMIYSLKNYIFDADMSLCTEIFYTLACLRGGTGSGGGVTTSSRQAERCSFSDTSDTDGEDATWVDDAVWYDSLWMDDDHEQSLELSYCSQVTEVGSELKGFRGKSLLLVHGYWRILTVLLAIGMSFYEYCNMMKRRSRDMETETDEELLLLVFPANTPADHSSGSLSSSVSLSDKSVSTDNNQVEEYIGDVPFAGESILNLSDKSVSTDNNHTNEFIDDVFSSDLTFSLSDKSVSTDNNYVEEYIGDVFARTYTNNNQAEEYIDDVPFAAIGMSAENNQVEDYIGDVPLASESSFSLSDRNSKNTSVTYHLLASHLLVLAIGTSADNNQAEEYIDDMPFVGKTIFSLSDESVSTDNNQIEDYRLLVAIGTSAENNQVEDYIGDVPFASESSFSLSAKSKTTSVPYHLLASHLLVLAIGTSTDNNQVEDYIDDVPFASESSFSLSDRNVCR